MKLNYFFPNPKVHGRYDGRYVPAVAEIADADQNQSEIENRPCQIILYQPLPLFTPHSLRSRKCRLFYLYTQPPIISFVGNYFDIVICTFEIVIFFLCQSTCKTRQIVEIE